MKRMSRILGAFLCLVMLLTGTAMAAGNPMIDVSTASDGYFTVDCDKYIGVKMKVGVTFQGKTQYYDYTAGEESSYTFSEGDGSYTITLYRNLYSTKYRAVTSTRAQVELADEMAPYLTSTYEVTFSADDPVGLMAAELCAEAESDADKIVAIHNYIARNFTYDYGFAAKVRSGEITTYVPNTTEVLAAGKGICYDFTTLFAAMCRSQDIPCAVAKGYLGGSYHAWNMIYMDEEWIAVDMTASVCRRNMNAVDLNKCVVSLDRYYGYTF